MKKRYALAVMLLIAVGAYAQEGKRLYNKYSDAEGVSAVYVSPAMFNLIGKIPELNVEVGEGSKLDMAPVIRSFTGFYMLDISDKNLGAELHKEVKAMIGKGRYEVLMEVKEGGSTMRIYTVGDDRVISSLVMLAQEGDSVQFICLEGTINRKDFENLMAKSIK